MPIVNRGSDPILGEQQQRQGAGHRQQQGVRAGDTPGDLRVSQSLCMRMYKSRMVILDKEAIITYQVMYHNIISY